MGYVTLVAGTTITSSWANANVRDQVVTPFASAAARTSAIAAPVEGMVSYLTDVNRFDFWNGTGWQPVSGVVAKVRRTGDQTIASGVVTPMQWQTVSYDESGFWSAGTPERLTAPWTGYYLASSTIEWSSSSSGTYRRLTLYRNGSPEDAVSEFLTNITDTNPLRQNVSAPLRLSATDFVEVRVTQGSGGDRTVDAAQSNMKLAYLGPAA